MAIKQNRNPRYFFSTQIKLNKQNTAKTAVECPEGNEKLECSSTPSTRFNLSKVSWNTALGLGQLKTHLFSICVTPADAMKLNEAIMPHLNLIPNKRSATPNANQPPPMWVAYLKKISNVLLCLALIISKSPESP